MIGTLIWLVLAILSLAGIGIAVVARQVVVAFLGLLLTMFCLGLLYVLAGAEFVGASQIMIYVGGILVLLAFGLMVSFRNQQQEAINDAASKWGSLLIALSVTSCMALAAYEFWASWTVQPAALENGKTQVKQIGTGLMTTHALPLEIAGLLLLAATIGALVVTRLGKEKIN